MKLVVDGDVRDPDLDLDIEVHHPILTPDDPDAWMLELLGGTFVAAEERSTELGWPFVLGHGVALGPDGTAREHRVGAFYKFFHFTAALVARARDAGALSQQLPQMVALASSARPDFRDERIVVLSALWGDPLQRLN